ncbi:hypothetical protein EC991_011496 [Linnemannia zychae]|nr:hypothetical protein EC991_011496 [Linnemannia zychae]
MAVLMTTVSAALKEVTDASFDNDVIKSSKPVVVEFWAVWCGGCKQINHVLEDISAEYGNEIEVVKLDADKNQKTGAYYGVKSLPTLIVYQGGEVVRTIIGPRPKSALLKELDSYITVKSA